MLCCPETSLAQESPHGKISFECSTCHTTDNWKIKKEPGFDHDATGFALTGQHVGLRCESCHEGLKFAKKSSDCLSCHTDVHKSELGANCLRCHTTQSWRISDMVGKHQASRFPLLGRHAALSCLTCHANASQKQFAGTPIDCYGCHRNDYVQSRSPNHTAAGFSTDCLQCHKVTSFVWSKGFDHAMTAFALTGAHTTTQCLACHKNQVFKSTATQCAACHQPAYALARNPNHVAAGFPTVCQTCHTTSAWQGARFDHGATRFPLTGAHLAVSCVECHQNSQYANTPTSCADCHRADFNGTTNPNHVQANFSTNCVQCHTVAAWHPATFNHATTRFPLTGRHAAIQCQDCHTSGNYQLVYTNCYPCHQTQFAQPQNPNHVLGNFNHDCPPCHTSTAWRPSTFNHNTTRFPLTGRHIGRECNDCHLNNVYANLPGTCWDCHANDYTSTQDPNHVQRNFSHDCTQCHSTNGWDGASFDHNTTNFRLTGRHATAQCVQCHINGNYQLTYTNCYPCHQTQFAQPQSPNHVLGNFNHDCAPCHTSTAWLPSTFNHANTNYPLVGAHQEVSCNQCHVNNQYQNLPHTCWDCHATDFNGTTNPNHQQGQFSHDCLTCHVQTAWHPATFNHATTRFPLTGRHAAIQCQDCHTNGNYQLVYTNCYPCHQTQFAQPQSPNHVLGNFNHDCAPCHTSTAWLPSTFNHANTNYPLVGAHQAVSCNQCHVNDQYQNLPHTCWDCHATDFNGTTNPNHQQGQFSHDCLTCHAQTAWHPATFNHATTNFPLTGRHAKVQCQDCHVNGNYQLQYTDCYPCHVSNFSQPQNPNHVLGNFRHDCTPCHTTTVWIPSTFNHGNTPFPLVGAHQAVSCNLCHVNNQYQNLPHTCWDCHATDFNGTTNPNHQQGQFSHDCLTCHTQAAWSPATFNHSTTNFPLTGAHVAATCISCHVNGNYGITYQNCYQCHQDDFSRPTNPNHVTLLFSYDCTRCHTTTAWAPSTYNHDTQYFRIYSGAHRNRWNNNCTSCHPAPGQYQNFTCTTSCHPQGETNNDHQGVSGYIYLSAECYRCHRND